MIFFSIYKYHSIGTSNIYIYNIIVCGYLFYITIFSISISPVIKQSTSVCLMTQSCSLFSVLKLWTSRTSKMFSFHMRLYQWQTNDVTQRGTKHMRLMLFCWINLTHFELVASCWLAAPLLKVKLVFRIV